MSRARIAVVIVGGLPVLFVTAWLLGYATAG